MPMEKNIRGTYDLTINNLELNCATDTDGLHCFRDIMNAQNMSPGLKGKRMEDCGAIESPLWSGTKKTIDHGLTRDSDKEGIVGEEFDEI